MIIYQITCHTNDSFYIGRTKSPLDKRLEQHLSKLSSQRHNKKFQNCFNKYGKESFSIETIVDLGDCDKKTAQLAEEYFLTLYWGDKKLLNCSKHGEGGHTTAGYNEDEMLAYKARLSAAHKGRPGVIPSAETRAKLSAAQQGDKNWKAKLTWDQVNQMRLDYSSGKISHSDLAKQYNMKRSTIAHIITGKIWQDPNYIYTPRELTKEDCRAKQPKVGPHSQETKDKISAGRLGENNPAAKLNWDIVREIRRRTETVGELAQEFGVSHSCISSIKTYKTWKCDPNYTG